jgi:hypothetical protein
VSKSMRRDMFRRNAEITRLYLDGKTTQEITPLYRVSESSVVEGLHRVLRALTNWAESQETTVPYTKEKYPDAFDFHSMHKNGFAPNLLTFSQLIEHKQFWTDQLDAYMSTLSKEHA